MRRAIIHLFTFSLLFLLTACSPSVPESYTESGELPKVYPDVIDVTVPLNIAPLTFQLDEEADGMIARYQRDGVEVVCEGKMQPSMSEWRELTTKAGDINVYGKRDSVIVIRQKGPEKKVYSLCLNSGKDIFASEAYYIQQNDVIYVKANDTKARQSNVPGNESRTLSFWLSLTSVLTAVAVLIFK